MLIDTHCHLSELSEIELNEQLRAAAEAGVSEIIVVGSGYGMRGVRRSVEICRDCHPERSEGSPDANCYKEILHGACPERNRRVQDDKIKLFCTLGVHPHEAKDMTEEDFAEIKHLVSAESKVVAIGEVGLDYHYLYSPKDVQRDVFRRFLKLAVELKKPMVIHDRACGTECVDLIKQVGSGQLVGQAHCFSGDWELAQKYLDLGFYISVTGVITFRKAEALREIIKRVPLDKLLVETDSPYLTPVPYRGKKNQPAYVKFVVEALAEIKGVSFDDMSETIEKNANKLFG